MFQQGNPMDDAPLDLDSDLDSDYDPWALTPCDGNERGLVTVRSLAGDIIWGPGEVDFEAPCGRVRALLAGDLMWPKSYLKLLHGGEVLDPKRSLKASSVADCATLTLVMSSNQELSTSGVVSVLEGAR